MRRLPARMLCAFTGHRWETGWLFGDGLILCARCCEIVAVLRERLCGPESARRARAMVSAALADDGAAWGHLGPSAADPVAQALASLAASALVVACGASQAAAVAAVRAFALLQELDQ